MQAPELLFGDIRPLRRVEYEQLVDSGVFEDERVELLDGIVVHMSPRDPLHDSVIEVLTREFSKSIPEECSLRVQSAFAATSRSRPEPDLAIVRFSSHRTSHPSQALLIVEVANASLSRDKIIKARIYAQAGVPEYWVIDLKNRVVEVRTRPEGEGYSSLTIVERGQELRSSLLPSIAVKVDELL